MHRLRTTIIVGAGASAEYGMPVGSSLREKIRKALTIQFSTFGDPQAPKGFAIGDAIQALASEQSASPKIYESACDQIVRALPGAESIDAYIDTRRDHPNVATIGKLAIVECILKEEAHSTLKTTINRRSIDLANVENTWGMKLARMVFDGCQKDDLISRMENLSLVVFNYDRCIEHFLCNYIQNQYAEDEIFAAKVVNALNVLHPYGKVGDLSWQSGDTSVPFGAEVGGKSILRLSRNIRTYTEQIQEKSTVDKVREAVNAADRLLFLGFAFHLQNMDLLAPENGQKRARVYGTVHGISESDVSVIRSDISSKLGRGKTARLQHCECNDLFARYNQELRRG